MRPEVVDAERAVDCIEDGATISVGGAGAGHAIPEKVLVALGARFANTGTPRGLHVLHPCGVGDSAVRGLNHIAHEGLVARAIGGFWGNGPQMTQLAMAEKIEAYNWPQGVLCHLMRAAAAKRPGVITTTGLHTFVDPRLEGGRINGSTTVNLNEVINLDGREYLFYRTQPIDVALIRGTSVDKEGNLTAEGEVGTFSMLSMAQAARNNGGKVIAQAKHIDHGRHADPCTVKVPAALIDYIVVDPEQQMTFLTDFDPALVKRDAPLDDDQPLEGARKIASRRAALELRAGAYVNVGYGVADGVPQVAQIEGVLDQIVFLIEQGAIGGIPTTGLNFGAMFNPAAIIDDGYQFDFFHGGGLDLAFLGFAQIDRHGNVNSSRFGRHLTGCGGFVDISQHARKVVFCGAFAVKGDFEIQPGRLQINHPGKMAKFVNDVQQVTFSGRYGLEKSQQVMYVTERAVFGLTEEGLELRELAPGVDLQRDVLALMDFKPIIPEKIAIMRPDIFGDGPLGKELDW